MVHIFTYGSKGPTTGYTAAAVYIPNFQVNIQKRIPNHVSVFTTELKAILLAKQLVKEAKPKRGVCSDCLSALSSLVSGESNTRQQLIHLHLVV